MIIRERNIAIHVEKDYEAMSKKAAGLIAEEVCRNPRSVLCFATGGTPIGTYRELVRMHRENNLDFSAITSFNLDEYYPISKANTQSFNYFMHQNLFSHINIPAENIHIPSGEAEDWQLEVEQYEDCILQAGGIDMLLLGIGHNGHIAFNEPDEIFSGFTHKVSISQETIQANARFFDRLEDVPTTALTMGIRSIMLSRKIVFIASGAEKAPAIRKSIHEAATPRVPGSALQFHQNLTMVLDRDAYNAIQGQEGSS